MPDLSVAVALFALVVLVEATPYIRVPIGLLLAIGMIADDAQLLPVVVIGSLGIAVARVGLALQARGGKERAVPPHVAAQRAALRARLADSSTFSRITFSLAALPGVPANFLFPILGAMRAPLGPAFLGTLLGRLPWLVITTTLFGLLGTLGSDSDRDATITLGVLAVLLLITGTIGAIDWQHRSQTGEWRMRDQSNRLTGMFTQPGAGAGQGSPFGPGAFGQGSPYDPRTRDGDLDDEDVIDGEVLGEEVEDDDDDAPAGPRRELDR